MIVLRNKADKKALNVSYTESGALFTTNYSGTFIACKDAKLIGIKNGFVQIEGDTTISPKFYLSTFEPITFITHKELKELDILSKKSRNTRLDKNEFFRLKDLKKLVELQQAEKAITIKARRMQYRTAS